MSEYSKHMTGVALQLLGEPKEKRGDQWRYGTHGSMALNMDTGTWYSHEEEQGGGVLDLIEREAGRAAPAEAIRWLEEQGFEQPTEKPAAKPKPRAKITATYDYVDANGELRYQVVRFEPKTFRQRKPDGQGWSWKIKGTEPLPYRLPDILKRDKATILIVEGEKDADRLADLGFVATCNSGGAGKWPEEISRYFERRNVIIVPDNDEAGRGHVNTVGAALNGVAESIRVMYLPGLPEKGDVSDWLDAGGDESALMAACKAAEYWQAPIVEEAPTDPEQPTQSDGRPFRALGYDGSHYYYMPRDTGQIKAISAASHSSGAVMCSMAPLEWWEMAYAKEKGGADWLLAASDCMQRCHRAGVYNPDNVRGCGAWYDKGEPVLHLGNRLIVAGEVRQLGEHESQYIYSRRKTMESIINAPPASNEDGKELFGIINHLNWATSTHGWLMSGFIALAPICGALKWRPHCWLTSQRGAGKSWCLSNIVQPLLGQSALMVQGETTSPGIRQALQHDARPILFDEAETEDNTSQRRMKSVIELARQSSFDGDAIIAKGTSDGSGMSFRVRSMFLMSSINVSLSQAADESRFSVVTLNTPDKSSEAAGNFREFERRVSKSLTPDACAALRSRMYELIPVIRQNAETMAQAVAEELGSQRIGDQIGTLMAGAMAYTIDRAITIDEARTWAAHIDLSDAQESEQVSDEQMCMQAILQAQVALDAGTQRVQRALSELVQAAAGKHSLGSDIYAADCNAALGRYGLSVDGSYLVVSNTHTQLKKILRDTPWASGWSRILKRLPGCEVPNAPQRFAGTQTRAVRLPLQSVM